MMNSKIYKIKIPQRIRKRGQMKPGDDHQRTENAHQNKLSG